MLLKQHTDQQVLFKFLLSAAYSGKHVTLVSPKLIDGHKHYETIYGNYVYYFGSVSGLSALELLPSSALIIYVKCEQHNELYNLILNSRVPCILVTKDKFVNERSSSFIFTLPWVSKSSLMVVANEIAVLCQSTFNNSMFVPYNSKASSLLASITSDWRKLWYTILPARRRSRVYKCLQKNNYKRKA